MNKAQQLLHDRCKKPVMRRARCEAAQLAARQATHMRHQALARHQDIRRRLACQLATCSSASVHHHPACPTRANTSNNRPLHLCLRAPPAGSFYAHFLRAHVVKWLSSSSLRALVGPLSDGVCWIGERHGRSILGACWSSTRSGRPSLVGGAWPPSRQRPGVPSSWWRRCPRHAPVCGPLRLFLQIFLTERASLPSRPPTTKTRAGASCPHALLRARRLPPAARQHVSKRFGIQGARAHTHTHTHAALGICHTPPASPGMARQKVSVVTDRRRRRRL